MGAKITGLIVFSKNQLHDLKKEYFYDKINSIYLMLNQ